LLSCHLRGEISIQQSLGSKPEETTRNTRQTKTAKTLEFMQKPETAEGSMQYGATDGAAEGAGLGLALGGADVTERVNDNETAGVVN
jgi:hypothetical protein